MAEPTIADLCEMMKSFQREISSMKADMAVMKEKSASSSENGIGGRADGPRDLDRPPKFQKLDFPRYDGKSDPMLFINKCESYFRQQRTMAEERVWMASYNLEDIAQLWFIQLQEDEGTPPWGRFKDLLNLRFGPPLRAAPLFELAECRRSGTVEEYSNRFQALLPRAGRLEEDQRVQLFMGGLLPPLSHAVRLHHPATLAAAMSLARQVEMMEIDRLQQAPAQPAPRAPQPAPAPRPALAAAPAPLALPAPVPRPALLAPLVRGGANPIKRLSAEEQADRRRLGLCYNCNEPYSRGHNRVCRRLFFIDGVEIDAEPAGDAATDMAAPVFSLHAVAGVPSWDTMQVQASLSATAVVALLDTGSTHNFIGERAAHRSGLPIQPRPRLTATVANGEKIACPGVICNAPVSVDGTTFHVDLFVMPLAGFDLVLGTQWLGTLGPII
ncbi:uncharacterized protein [Miscanthus floridulus]|uniref:uncharacterized protein n=1 Tax=Miscanthus floridulus TaxID=154761 RepID=UPI0034582720